MVEEGSWEVQVQGLVVGVGSDVVQGLLVCQEAAQLLVDTLKQEIFEKWWRNNCIKVTPGN